jgi:DNA topoisomerase IA
MADQIVITEKTSQANDVRAAIGSRYGDVLPAEGHLFDLLEPEDVVPAWKRWSPILLDLKVFTVLARQRVATRPLSSRPFARHCALPNEFGLQPIVTARVS